MHLFKLTDEQLAQILIPKRFVPPTPPEHEGKNMVYVFDSEDKFERLMMSWWKSLAKLEWLVRS